MRLRPSHLALVAALITFALATVEAAATTSGTGLFVIGRPPVLPQGAAGKLAPVAYFSTGMQLTSGVWRMQTEQDVVFVLRNNTGHALHNLYAEAVVVDAHGHPLAEERDLGVQPWVVPRHGLALGSFSFTADTPGLFPVGAKLRINANGAAGVYQNPVDIPIASAKAFQLTGAISGLARNTTGRRIEGPPSLMYACFNRSNHITNFGVEILDSLQWILPGQQIPFSLLPTAWDAHQLHVGGTPCVHALVSLIGLP
jgi:hypothetical protein